jgi:hypothetical protein
MVEIPFSPIPCAVVTTTMLALTFYLGEWCGIKQVMNRIEEEMEKEEELIWIWKTPMV